MGKKPDTQHGFDFEESFAAEYGLDTRPGSGNQWFARGDVGGHGMTFSLKSTKNKNFELGINDLEEIVDICEGPGGDNRIPAMAVGIGGRYEVVVLRSSDFRMLLEADHDVSFRPSVARQRRAEAERTLLDTVDED